MLPCLERRNKTNGFVCCLQVVMSSSGQYSARLLRHRVRETNNTTARDGHPVVSSHPSSEVCDIFFWLASFFFFLSLLRSTRTKQRTMQRKHHRWHIMIDVSILLMLSYHFLNERRKWPITQCIHRSIDHSWCLLRRDANWSGSPKRSGYERLKINVELNFKGCLNRRSSSWRNCISFFCTSLLLADFAVSTSLENTRGIASLNERRCSLGTKYYRRVRCPIPWRLCDTSWFRSPLSLLDDAFWIYLQQGEHDASNWTDTWNLPGTSEGLRLREEKKGIDDAGRCSLKRTHLDWAFWWSSDRETALPDRWTWHWDLHV